MSMSIGGKVCVVTVSGTPDGADTLGGSGGIASAIAKAYLEAGCAGLTLVDLAPDRLAVAVDRLPQQYHDRVLTVVGDVTHQSTHDEYVRQTVARWGRLDVSVQTAGVCSAPAGILDTKAEDWDSAFAVNARGVFLGLQASVRAMLSSPSKGKDCAVVLIASQFGLEGLAGFSAYTASKFAVRGLMQVAAQEFAPHGIRVNAVCPGRELFGCEKMLEDEHGHCMTWTVVLLSESSLSHSTVFGRCSDHPVDTDMLRVNTPEQIRQIVAGVPLGRYAQPAEIASAVLFLSSSAGSFCSGTAMKVDGGMAKFA